MSTNPSFFAELKRRNVHKVAVAYAVVAWPLMQVASQIFPFHDFSSEPKWLTPAALILRATKHSTTCNEKITN
jgi:hypothetical protein